MGRTIAALLVASTALSGCSGVRDSRANPFNWFGGGRDAPVSTDAAGNPLIPARRGSILRDDAPVVYGGTPVEQITELQIERRPGGVIVRATGLAARTGAFDVRLVPDEDPVDPAVLGLTLRALVPAGPVGPEGARRVTAALALTDQELGGVSRIDVRGATNLRSARR